MKQVILFFALAGSAFGQYTIGGWTAATAGTGGSSTASTPTFSPVAGPYSSAQTVTISATTGTVICYNTTGSPATNGGIGCTTGSIYAAPVAVSSTETLYAVSGGTGYTDSAVGSAAYTITLPSASTPTFSPVAGTYGSTQSVTISTSTGSVICFNTIGTPATNGTTGCTTGTKYTTAVTVSFSETLYAVSGGTGYTDSSPSSASYTISAPTLVHYYAGYSTSLGTAQTLGFTTTAGDFIVVGFMGHASGPTGATASGHALTLAGNNTCGSDGCLYLFFLPNAAAVSQFQSSSSASYATAFFFAEFSGVSATAAVSGTCGIGLSTNASISTWTAPASHTAVAGELVISANEMYYGTSSTITSQTATSPWILFDQYNATAQGVGGLMEYQSNVSPGTYTGGGTASPAVSGYLGTVTCGFI